MGNTLTKSSLVIIVFSFCSFGFANPVCTTKAETFLKKTPSAKARISWRVGKYMPFMTTGKEEGGFLEVRDVDGQQHWISKRDVSQQVNCVVIKASSAKLKTGPGKSYDNSPLGLADKYTPFLDIGGEDGWTQVKDDSGIISWIQIDQLWRVRKKVRMSFERG